MQKIDEIKESKNWLSSEEYAFSLGKIYFHTGGKNPFDGQMKIAFDRGWLEEMHMTLLLNKSVDN